MNGQHQYEELCAEFSSAYAGAQKNINKTIKLGGSLIGTIESEIALNQDIDCTSGCTYCCNLRVVAFPFEIIAIYIFIATKLDEAKRELVQTQLDERHEQIMRLSREEHFTTNISCPLLIDDRCSVYSVRPIACAGYHSASVDACRDSHENPDVIGTDGGGIPQFQSVVGMSGMAHAAASTVISHLNQDANQYELVKSLKEVFRDKRLVQRWRSGRRIFTDPG